MLHLLVPTGIVYVERADFFQNPKMLFHQTMFFFQQKIISYECNIQHFNLIIKVLKEKPNFYYSRGITHNMLTSSGAHFRGLSLEQQSAEETSQRWRLTSRWRHCVRFKRPRIEAQSSAAPTELS